MGLSRGLTVATATAITVPVITHGMMVMRALTGAHTGSFSRLPASSEAATVTAANAETASAMWIVPRSVWKRLDP